VNPPHAKLLQRNQRHFIAFADDSRLLAAPMPDRLSQVVAAPQSDKRARILVVEDDALVAGYIRTVLDEAGYGVAGTAASGLEALALAARAKPMLALVDIRIAGPIDGIELACALRERFDVPAIFLSGMIDPAVAERAMTARPLGFLHKPFRPSQVFNAIERALKPSDR
jgi:two-component system, response regulator PdtaR